MGESTNARDLLPKNWSRCNGSPGAERKGVKMARRKHTAEQIINKSSGPHHQDSGEAKMRESTAGVFRKPSSEGKARGCSSKHLCGLTAWNT